VCAPGHTLPSDPPGFLLLILPPPPPTHPLLPFLTHSPAPSCLQLVRSLTVCRIMAISRPNYTAICAAFPNSARTLLANLQQRAEGLVQAEFRGGAASRLLRGSMVSTLPGLTYNWTSAEQVRVGCVGVGVWVWVCVGGGGGSDVSGQVTGVGAHGVHRQGCYLVYRPGCCMWTSGRCPASRVPQVAWC
jgi:hypothetical protein